MAAIETRLPAASKWVREVTAVDPKAKTGYDWTGDFYHGGGLIDLEPGTLIADCNEVGSRKSPRTRVRLRVLLPTGAWHVVAEGGGKEWAYELRKTAREWLALPEQQRVARCLGAARTEVEGRLAGRRERLAAARAVAAALPATVAAWAAGTYPLEPGRSPYFELPMPEPKSTSTSWAHHEYCGVPDSEGLLARAAESAAKRVAAIEQAVAEAEAELEALADPPPTLELGEEERALVEALLRLTPDRRELILKEVIV